MNKELTKQELSDVIFKTMVAKAILANQNALAHNEVLSKTHAYKFMVKKLGAPYIQELIKLEKSHFDLVEKAEKELPEFKGANVIDQAFEKSRKIYELLARMVFTDYDDIETVLTALAKDKSSILGIAKKILK